MAAHIVRKQILYSGWWYWLLAIVLVILDQGTKFWSKTILSQRPLNLGFVTFDYAMNTGASFSMLQDMNNTLVWVSVIVLGCLMYWYHAMVGRGSAVQKSAYTLIVAGILGNLVDRLFFGFVTDFIDLHWWPIFNVADSCLVVGVVMYVCIELFARENDDGDKKRKSKNVKGRKG